MDREFEEIRALVEIGAAGNALSDADQRPLAQVRRGEKVDGVPFPLRLHVEHHHPFLRRLVPDHFRVAIAAGDFFQHGIRGELREGATVVAVGEALRRGIARRGVKQHERR